MKFFKRLLVVVLTAAMLLPLGIVSTFADELGDNWTTMAAKYSSSTYNIIETKKGSKVIKTDGFSFTANEAGGIDVVIPDYKTFGGSFGTAVLSSNSKTALDGLTVTLSAADNFLFNTDTSGFSPSVNLIWSDSKIEKIYDFDTKIGISDAIPISTNGLRYLAPNTGDELAVVLNNSRDWIDPNDLTGKAVKNMTYGSNLMIILFKEGWEDKGDGHPGYRWTFSNRNNVSEYAKSNRDLSQIKQSFEVIDAAEMTYEFCPDTTHGYIVKVNGKEYYDGKKVGYFPNNTGVLEDKDYTEGTDDYLGSMTYAKADIDLSSLVGKEGYLAIGMTGNLSKNETGFTLDTINGVPAAQWNGQTIGDHVHDFIEEESATKNCTEDGYERFICSCGAHYRVPDATTGHKWILVDEIAPGCLIPGEQHRRCAVCGETQTIYTPAIGHSFVDYGFPLKDGGNLWGEWEVTTAATPESDGVISRTCNNCGEVQTRPYAYSDADKIADKWFISAENRYYTLNQNRNNEKLVYTTVGEDGSITLKDIVAEKEDGVSAYSITKITSKYPSELNGFTAKVSALPASEVSDLRPTTLSFMWTNEYDNYRFAGQFSSGLYLYYREIMKSGIDEVTKELNPEIAIAKTAGRPLGSSMMEDSRSGYAWSHYIPLEEYSFTLTLMDYLTVTGSYTGTQNDNVYDVVTYAVVSRGDFWILQSDNIGLAGFGVDATEPIEIGVEYFVDDWSNDANTLCYLINGEEYFTQGFSEAMNYQKMFYFSMAAYSDGVNDDRSHGASFTLHEVCGVPAAEFTGYEDPTACEHDWTDYEYKLDDNGEPYSSMESCIRVGQKIRYCTKCNAAEIISIPKTEHKLETDHPHYVVEPTCVERGIAWYYCNAVANFKTGATHGPSEQYFVPPTGIHTWSDWEEVKPASCGSAGEEIHTCSVCGTVESRSIDPISEHSLGEWVVDTEPTYTRPGHRYAICTNCGEVVGEDIAQLELPENPFKDVPENSWYTLATLACFDRGFVTGVSNNEFGPTRELSRAQFVTILAKVAGADLSSYEGVQTQFTDVPTGKWYSASVAWATENGYSSGISATLFGTNNIVSREQLSAFLRTYATNNNASGKDAADITGYDDYDKISNWAKVPMAWAVGNGLISGTTPTTLAPKTNATRAQVVVIVNQFVDNVLLAPKPVPEASK